MDSTSPAVRRITVDQLLQHVPQVAQNFDDDRFELWLGGALVAILDYRVETSGGDSLITVVRTVLHGEAGGPALANILAAEAMLRLGAQDTPVRVICPIAQSVLDRHPEIPVPIVREAASAELSIAG